MEWDLCSSASWVPFHSYTMFLNIPVKIQEKSIINHKVLVTQSSNIVHCDQHSQKPIFKSLWTFFPFENWHFIFFVRGSYAHSHKIDILLLLTGKNALKWLQWCIYRVWGVLNPMVLLLSVYDKQILTNPNFKRKTS